MKPPYQTSTEKSTEAPAVDNKLIDPTRLLRLGLILALAVVGYLLGPADLVRGYYQAEVRVAHKGVELVATLPFQVSDGSGAIQTATDQTDGYTLVAEGQVEYPYGLGQRINYRAQLQDQEGSPVGLELEDFTSSIEGPSYDQSLPATDRAEGWMLFTMRIPFRAKVITSLLFAVAGLWLTELVPLAAASLLIPVVAAVAGVAGEATVYQSFFHPIVVLFFAGFLLAEGMRHTGVDRVIALNILRHSSMNPLFLMLTMMLLTAFFSLWMSNTASVALMIPIALAVLNRLPQEGERTGFRRALILGVAYSATVGGIGSAIGTPANILALDFLNQFTGADLSFTDWFPYGLPMVTVMIPVIWVYLTVSYGIRTQKVSPHLTRDVYEEELKELGRLDARQKILLLVFASIIGLWLTESYHQIDTSIVALAGVLVLFFTRTISEGDLGRINWNALLTFGGGLAIGNLLLMTGFSDWVALKLTGLAHLPPMLVVFFVAVLTLVTGAFISNTACAAMLIPLAIPLARVLQLDPRLLVSVIAIASSIDFALVVGTPPTMMAYSTGMFNVKDIFRRGLWLDAIGILVLSFGMIWFWKWLGVISF